ncbi:hypothetical protein M406DRAFT_74122 [Cryphonectria parasitica EP155]|uniref:Uncharacterized protein n=1 Tax=Cryphonectria parasitica (strain ATCC 38755 / EP155) TaxID=660469 RepID=A0A9P4XYV2_CRYP1|nr:uncharacterized protein M406DRAFT_74122 [Cryphonectria parasitica EP155]KAF3763528.1 hypothetical protein M406DRAFT_74122 [Cryphonectria parasitica EP155]
MTAEILQNFNPLKDLTNSITKNLWETQFEDLKACCLPSEAIIDLSNYIVYARQHIQLRSWKRQNLVTAMQAACIQFSNEPGRILRPALACRTHPLPSRLEKRMDCFFRWVSRSSASKECAVPLAASALIREAHNAGLDGWPPVDVFDSVFASLNTCLEKRHRISLRQQFLQDYLRAVILRHLSFLSRIEDVVPASICSFCIVHDPSYLLDCGHRICISGYDFQLKNCVVCNTAMSSSIVVKPHAAGVRVLKLCGKDGIALAQSLTHLSRILPGPWHNYFDLVIGSDTGILFVVLLFCKNATLGDCLWHIERTRDVRWGSNGLELVREQEASARRQEAGLYFVLRNAMLELMFSATTVSANLSIKGEGRSHSFRYLASKRLKIISWSQRLSVATFLDGYMSFDTWLFG